MLKQINEMSYEIEYDKMLHMALYDMQLPRAAAQRWAKEAVEDQMQVDKSNLESALRKANSKATRERILHAQARRRAMQALETPAATPTAQQLQQDLSDLFAKLSL